MFDRAEGFDDAIALLREGGAIGILSDQHAGDQGLWTPLFGKLASTTPLPSLLARRTGAALISVAVYTDGVARWRMQIEPVNDGPNESVDGLTAQANAMIEKQVRRAPEDWFWVHDRWKTPNPHFLLTRYKRGVHVLPSVSLKPFRILVRSSNWLGDAVMSAPAVRAIKRSRTDAHLTVLAPANLAPMWKLFPEVDHVIALPRKSLFGAIRAVEKQHRFDVAIVFPNSLRAALEVWLADVPRRVGYRGHRRAWLLNQIVPERNRIGPPKHQARRYLHLARKIGARTAGWREKLCSLGNDAKPATPIRLALCPGAEYGPAKRWLPERFAESAKAIVDLAQVEWVLLGTKKDVDLGKKIADAIGNGCVNRIGETDLGQLIAELRACRLCLTNDTGTMHLATLLGIPVVAIFGSTEPALTGPLGQGHIVIRHHVECSPCFLRECPIDFRCMRAVGVDEVLDAIMSILRRDVITSAA